MAGERPRLPKGEAQELLDLLDRLEAVLAGSGLAELEVEVGETALVLRKPVAAAAPQDGRAAGLPGAGQPASAHDVAHAAGPTAQPAADASPYHQILAPLTGLYYAAPTPDAAPYVREGGEVNVGQVIGLIEAMKLFNEIKSDVRGRVVRIVAENGALIKARQPLLEVEPA
ncbi:MAG: acetyl-CoA carboxylase biotin carboxyl carrier protein [Candidatus Limnocylindrales bacterium]